MSGAAIESDWVLALESRAGSCKRRWVRTLVGRGKFLPSETLLLPVLFLLSCRQILGLQPREVSGCSDPFMIDDMEDGDEVICKSTNRDGNWFRYGYGASTNLEPAPGKFTQTQIPGGRGSSHYAARLKGSGYDVAAMGFTFDVEGLAVVPYNVGMTEGIKFWMRSSAAVSVNSVTPETLAADLSGGACVDTNNCGNFFASRITTPNPDAWVEYFVPFSSLAQLAGGGSATWSRSRVLGFNFIVENPSVAFEVWVDDIAFFACPGCVSPCTDDPAYPKACPAVMGAPARCISAGMACSPGIVVSGTGGSSGTSGVPGTDGAVALGCNASNTTVAPADGVIATFMGANGGVDIPGSFSPPSGAAGPTYTTDGILHVTLDAVRTSEVQVRLVVDHFDSCVDATQFEGVQFSISGSRPGCAFGFFAEDGPHLYNFGQPSGSHGSGPLGSHPTFVTLTDAQIAAEPQTVMIPFASLADGFPATPVDKTKITGVGWVFFVGPSTDGGATSCVADLTIDDVRFY